jgi:hypothetical protein
METMEIERGGITMNATLLLETAAAVALFTAGSAMVYRGAGAWIQGGRETGGPIDKIIGMVSGFRAAIIGLALIGIGLWLLTGQLWILVLSVAVAGEEILETSFILYAMRSDPRVKSRHRAASRSRRIAVRAG